MDYDTEHDSEAWADRDGAVNTAALALVPDPYAGVPSLADEASEYDSATGTDGASLPNTEAAPGMWARLLDRAQLATLPRPEPLIDDTLDLGTVAVLAGYWGTCKSFIAQDWSSCIATGKRWQGRASEQRKVLYIASEGAYGMHDRLSSWEYGWRQDIDPAMFSVLPVTLNLGKRTEVDQLAHLVAAGEFGFVVIDTLAKCMYGLDENSAQDMGRVVDGLYRLRDATNGGTVLAIHHTGKDKTTIRGSSALEAGVDTVYTTEGDTRTLKLSRTKRKDGPSEDILTLTLKPVEHTNSAVIVSAISADIGGRALDLMSVFMSAFSETGASKADLRAAAEMAPATFARSLNTLVREGALINHGTEQRPFYRAGAK